MEHKVKKYILFCPLPHRAFSCSVFGTTPSPRQSSETLEAESRQRTEDATMERLMSE